MSRRVVVKCGLAFLWAVSLVGVMHTANAQVLVDVCPCWNEEELQVVTLENQTSYSCSGVSTYPSIAVLGTFEKLPERHTEFGAAPPGVWLNETPVCYVAKPFEEIEISDDDLKICFSQIAKRCSAMGDPIPFFPDPVHPDFPVSVPAIGRSSLVILILITLLCGCVKYKTNKSHFSRN